MPSLVILKDAARSSMKLLEIWILEKLMKVRGLRDWAKERMRRIGLANIEETSMTCQTEIAGLRNQYSVEQKMQANACDAMNAMFDNIESGDSKSAKLRVIRSNNFKAHIKVLHDSRARQATLLKRLLELQKEEKSDKRRQRLIAKASNKSSTTPHNTREKSNRKINKKIAGIMSHELDNAKSTSEDTPMLGEDDDEDDEEFDILEKQLEDVGAADSGDNLSEEEMQRMYTLLNGKDGASIDDETNDESGLEDVIGIISRLNNRQVRGANNASNSSRNSLSNASGGGGGSSSRSSGDAVRTDRTDNGRGMGKSRYNNVFSNMLGSSGGGGGVGDDDDLDIGYNNNNNRYNINASVISDEANMW